MTSIRDAATVVVVRPGDNGLETYMLRRHGDPEFMARVWVFPGGGLDDQDRRAASNQDRFDLSPRRAARQLGIDDGPTALAIMCCAIRETFEEAGILLARADGDDAPMSFRDPQRRRDFRQIRTAVDEGQCSLLDVAHRRNLLLAARRLHYFAHWITPHFESRRYDTHFFVARHPAGQTASHDDGETTHGRWWSAKRAIAAYRDGDIELAPPTLRILEQLRGFSSIPKFFADIDQRPQPPTILPAVGEATGDSDVTLLLPGDPDYPSADPEFAVATPVRDGVTRIVRRRDQWFSIGDGDRH